MYVRPARSSDPRSFRPERPHQNFYSGTRTDRAPINSEPYTNTSTGGEGIRLLRLLRLLRIPASAGNEKGSIPGLDAACSLQVHVSTWYVLVSRDVVFGQGDSAMARSRMYPPPVFLAPVGRDGIDPGSVEKTGLTRSGSVITDTVSDTVSDLLKVT
jgi:hypothetical protein